MSDAKSTAAEGIPAATVIIFRNARSGGPPEILMVVRSRSMSFAGGAAVFPGGRLDPEDRELAQRLAPDMPEDEAAHRIAAIRETLEETGLAIGIGQQVDAATADVARQMLLKQGALAPVLQEFGWTLDLGQLHPFSRWFPQNERLPRIFDTRFYLHDLGTGAVDIAIDRTENTHLFWTSAEGALAAADREEITIIFPTRRNLERLALFGDFGEVLEHIEEYPSRTIIPRLVERGGERFLTIPDDAGYPVSEEKLERALRG